MRAVVLAVLLTASVAAAQPDVERAKDLYKSAEAAMRESRYDDAIRDYGAAYEITKDPVFFYKIGGANERAGKCDVALIYYRRYLKEGKPSEEFAKRTNARIAACGGDQAEPRPDVQPPDATPDARPPDVPDARPPDAPAPDTKPTPRPTPRSRPEAKPSRPPPDPLSIGAEPTFGESSRPPPASGGQRGPWLLIGGTIAAATIGAVFAYSAEAAERDIDDLYVGLNDTPPPFNDTTRKLYDDAIAEGRRYQTLSITSFALAGAMAIGATVWFVLGKDETVTVAPAAAPGTAVVSTSIRF